ncbi:hypothetical protein [Geobacillus kaustophilus]|uniref:hypothetical protein n=1 Tax=Geobacillus kaustophilus TaxID=1462 RepID=UPI0027DCD454|nr:hypothetical protein [Geobacillus kaustophilus]WMJ21542.1 hypothetical protein RA957_08585 [Geobacillus kaustophilus]
MNNIENEVKRIEAIIDQDYEGLDYWNINRDTALKLLCTLFEEWVYQLDQEIFSFTEPQKIKLNGFIITLVEALDWLIRMTFKKNKIDGCNVEDVDTLIKYTQEAFAKAIIHVKAEQIFLPFWKGLYMAKVDSKNSNKDYIEFEFHSHDVAVLEGINFVLLEEYNHYKLKKLEKVEQTIKKLFGNVPEMHYHTMSIARTEFDFDFPDDYNIGPYTIGDIKNVWRRVIREAYWADRHNRDQKLIDRDSLPDLWSINVENWVLTDVKEKTALKLIDDLTYTGRMKGKQRSSKPLLQPIFQLSDGTRFISPRFILYNQLGRNIITILNRIYGDEANQDADSKETIFIKELIDVTSQYPNLSVCHDVPVDGTNVDFGILDTNDNTLALFELKWFVEPVTAVEIQNKDEEISKGLHEQLPKYEDAIKENGSKFTLKAFGKEIEINESFYFVLTRLTIGSGLIKPSPYKTINIRMLKKALFDTNGNLNEACRKLYDGFYYPKINEDFSLEKAEFKMGNVTVIADSIKKLDSSYDLSIPSDSEVSLLGFEMNPEKVPQMKFKHVGSSIYILTKDSMEEENLGKEGSNHLETSVQGFFKGVTPSEEQLNAYSTCMFDKRISRRERRKLERRMKKAIKRAVKNRMRDIMKDIHN